MNKNNCFKCYNSDPVHNICDITHKEIKDDGILENDCENFKAICSECEIEDPVYKYENDFYCPECLLGKLESEGKIETWTVKHYMLNDDYIGNDNDNYIEDITDDITKHLKINKINVED